MRAYASSMCSPSIWNFHRRALEGHFTFSKNNNANRQQSIMNIEIKNNEETTQLGNESAGAVPSGFILKLYQMVNGAPDEVISVSAIFSIVVERTVKSGEAELRNSPFRWILFTASSYYNERRNLLVCMGAFICSATGFVTLHLSHTQHLFFSAFGSSNE
eukprot:scaffold2751_cov131-Cylindrotheca_fusiformis.AAC.4